MKNTTKIFTLGVILAVLGLILPANASAQCNSNGNSPGAGYVINQVKADSYMSQFFSRGSSRDFIHSVEVTYLSSGYRITILDTPKCNNGNFSNCFPYSFITVIEVDCDFRLVAIAQT